MLAASAVLRDIAANKPAPQILVGGTRIAVLT
jgi:hypothetical protein